MNNSEVQQQLDQCGSELDKVKLLVDTLGQTSNAVPYLTKYSIIRACGSIETSFKSIITDCCSFRSKKQVKNFINHHIRNGSANPSYQNICKILKLFDDNWSSTFKSKVNEEPNKTHLLSSLQSLVDARNEFAHGGNPGSSISDVQGYFSHARRIVEILDTVVN